MLDELTYTATHIRPPITNGRGEKDVDWRETADEWRITIEGQSFPYFTGVGKRKAKHGKYYTDKFPTLYRQWSRLYRVSDFLEVSEPVPPTKENVLESLCSDAYAGSLSFYDFCFEFDYDTDSIKALDTYKTCQEIVQKMRKAGIDVEAVGNYIRELEEVA